MNLGVSEDAVLVIYSHPWEGDEGLPTVVSRDFRDG